MNIQTIPNTNLRVSEICLGCGDMGGGMDRAGSYALLNRYLELGGNFLDTAHIYNDWIPGERSRSEKLIGAWMRTRRNRDDLVVSTKGGHPNLRHMDKPRLSANEIINDLDESLIYLQVDTIDLYWLHRDDPGRPVEEIMDVLAQQVRAGKIIAYGASNWRVERLRAAQEYSAQAGLPPFVADQVLWNAAAADRQAISDPTIHVMDQALWHYHQSTGLAAIPYSSQANGYFNKLDSGKIATMNPGLRAHYPLEANQPRLDAIRQIRALTGLTVTQIVLGYLLSQPFVTIPIIGPKNIEQLEDSMQACGVRLTAEQIISISG
jgi:aryl-alcohol dehydrogenase-like predicted oxidoreductase